MASSTPFLKCFKKTIFLVSLVSISSLAILSFNKNDAAYFEIAKNLDIFGTLFRELNIYYVDETKPGQLLKKGIDEMLRTLDPYTVYIAESDVEDYRFMTTGQYGGIGSTILNLNNEVFIAEPNEGYAAFKADLRSGDKILEIDGKKITSKKNEEITKLLKGQAGTSVKLIIERYGEKSPITKNIVREDIKVKNVPYSGFISEDIGYIMLTGFTENSANEVRNALIDLKSKNANIKGLVFDLRGNPGGLLNEAVDIVNIFVEKNQEIVSTKGKVREWEKQYKSLRNPVDLNLPMAVLVNSGSASASEIVSGSIQDLDRGVIIGQRTFGKGLVQSTRDLSYNAKLKITTAKYYIPSGRCIQALDYSNRNEDGSVGKVPDSLMKTFKTKAGRKVLDGGGVLPDITIESKKYSKIITSLINKGVIFEYATKFKYTQAAIGESALAFRLTDAQYEDFCQFAATKDYDYITKSEKMLKDLKETAEKEKYFDKVKVEYDELQKKLVHNKQEDLQLFKAEVKDFLESEIASRYYYRTGRLQNDLSKDEEVIKAIELLNNSSEYKKLLSVQTTGNK